MKRRKQSGGGEERADGPQEARMKTVERIGGGADLDQQQQRQQQKEESPAPSVVAVGYSFMAKKMESMAEVLAVAGGGVDGVEFRPLDFSKRPDEHTRLDVILHKLSEDIMFRDTQPEGNARLSWIEAYLSGTPGTVIIDPIERVANCINRVTTLKLLDEAYRKHSAAGGMPRSPRFVVLEKPDSPIPGIPGIVARSGLAFPVICKPVEACGTRGSHTMVVVLDQAGMAALTPPVVVQEYRNHGARLFKVCVVGDEVRVLARTSLPDLPPGLGGSFAFDSQKPYPTLPEIIAAATASLVPASAPGSTVAPSQDRAASTPAPETPVAPARAATEPATAVPSAVTATKKESGAATATAALAPATGPGTRPDTRAEPCSVVSTEAARSAAVLMREAFGLSLFGFDLIIDGSTAETLVIDVNYFPSFRSWKDFPQVLRRRLREVVATGSGADQMDPEGVP